VTACKNMALMNAAFCCGEPHVKEEELNVFLHCDNTFLCFKVQKIKPSVTYINQLKVGLSMSGIAGPTLFTESAFSMTPGVPKVWLVHPGAITT